MLAVDPAPAVDPVEAIDTGLPPDPPVPVDPAPPVAPPMPVDPIPPVVPGTTGVFSLIVVVAAGVPPFVVPVADGVVAGELSVGVVTGVESVKGAEIGAPSDPVEATGVKMSLLEGANVPPPNPPPPKPNPLPPNPEPPPKTPPLDR